MDENSERTKRKECRITPTIMLYKKLKVIQHNVLAWTYRHQIELCNYYQLIDPDVILINATGRNDQQRIKIFNYNVYQKKM